LSRDITPPPRRELNGEWRNIQGFGGENRRQGSFGRPRCKWKCNISTVGRAGGVVVKGIRYKPAVAGSIADGVIGIFQ
jgi:hypothetical protein